jgi:hypothetical protein
MDTESWNVAEERRVRKLQQIRQLLSIALGPDVDLNQEAKNLIAQWKFGRLKLVLHCNACCAITTKYTTSSSTLKTRNGLAKSEPRPAALARGGLQHREAARTASSANVEPLCRHHCVVLQVSFMQRN